MITEEKCMLRETELHEEPLRSFLGAGDGRSNLDRTQDTGCKEEQSARLRVALKGSSAKQIYFDSNLTSGMEYGVGYGSFGSEGPKIS